ncbi:unnamed protein product [Didymodactylos carnosus]|uniref:Uncharacterized protein n=1 Tax=Didymodactylos carnosus TaxID=1234261 RepID=A0A813PLI1_9BILA|nr:unnamed protein product [Didymodactylos carnosus]CAF3537568.1 unnamed protein product [Didymodactylos carnosus]
MYKVDNFHTYGLTPLDLVLPISSYNTDKRIFSDIKSEIIDNVDNENSPQARTKTFLKTARQLVDENKFNTSLAFTNNLLNSHRSKVEILRSNSPTLKRLIAVRTKLEKYLGSSVIRTVSATKREKSIDTPVINTHMTTATLIQPKSSNIISQPKQSQSQSQSQTTSSKTPLDKITYENISYGGNDVMKKCSLEIWLPKAEYSPDCQSSRASTAKESHSSSLMKKSKIPSITTIKSRRQSIGTIAIDDDKRENQSELSSKSHKHIKFIRSNNDGENKSNNEISDKNTNDNNEPFIPTQSKNEPPKILRTSYYDKLESNDVEDETDINKLGKTVSHFARKRTSFQPILSTNTSVVNSTVSDNQHENVAQSNVKNTLKQQQQTVPTPNNAFILNELMRKYTLIKKAQYETDQLHSDSKDLSSENIHNSDMKTNTSCEQTTKVSVKRLVVDLPITSTKTVDKRKLLERRPSRQTLNVESSMDTSYEYQIKNITHRAVSNPRSVSASGSDLNMLTGKPIVSQRNKALDIVKSSKIKNEIQKTNLPIVTDDVSKTVSRTPGIVSVPQILMTKPMVPAVYQRSKTLDITKTSKLMKNIAMYELDEDEDTLNDTRDTNENTNADSRHDMTINANSELNETMSQKNLPTETQTQLATSAKATRPESSTNTYSQSPNLYGPIIPNMFQRATPNSINNSRTDTVINKITVEEPRIYSDNKRPLIALRPDISDKMPSKSSSPTVQLVQYHNPVTNYHSGQLTNSEKVVVHLKYSTGKTWSKQGFVPSPSP